jgi:hypothetical protein
MFGMVKCKPIITLCDVSAKLSKGQHLGSMEEECEMANVPYKVAINSLMYYMVGTKLALVVIVGVVALFFNNFRLPHW